MESIENKEIAISGTLEGFLANQHGDIDALEIAKQQDKIKINFPPHTAKAITEAASQGQLLSLICQADRPKQDPKGDKKAKLILKSLTNTENTQLLIAAIQPVKPQADQSPEVLHFQKFELVRNKKGELTGIRSGKRLVHIHKEDQQLADQIKADSRLAVSAVKRTDDGFINENNDEVYHLREIMVDGQSYKIKK